MQHHQKDNAGWAQENGYELNAETTGALSKGASSLDVFRNAASYRDHVIGIQRNRRFEILDVRFDVMRGSEAGSIWKTVALIPTTGLDLPNFDLLPRRENPGMSFLGIQGLELKLPPTAPLEERQIIDAFNKQYCLFAGGAFESMAASIKSANHQVPSLEDMTSICKPSVLKFLATAATGFIGVQDGYLTIRAPETRIITGAFSDTIMKGKERDDLLSVANNLLDALANAASEPPIRSLTLENTFRPAMLLGTIIGGVIGFCVGGFMGILLLFLSNYDYLSMNVMLALVPALAFGGVAAGSLIGKTLTRG